jgi:hypothetical protein
MKDFAIIIKKNNYENNIVNNNTFYIKSILYYGLNICEDNILFLDFSTNIEDYYYNIVCIKEYSYNLLPIPKRTLYVYIDNSKDDLLENTYSSYYFYCILELFSSQNIFVQYAGILIYDEPILQYYLCYNIDNITVELSDVYHEFSTAIVIVDNYNINDMVLNLIDFDNKDIDFFTFILHNVKCTMYSNILISKNNYIYKININDELSIFYNNDNPITKNLLMNIYELDNKNKESLLT